MLSRRHVLAASASSAPIPTVADLKGRKVGYARGSSSHNYIAAALEQHGLDLGDIQSVSLGAADASFAFGPRPTSTRPPGPCRPRPGSPADVLAEVNRNAGFDVVPLDTAILDAQQATADRLQRLGVVPRRVNVRDIVWADRT